MIKTIVIDMDVTLINSDELVLNIYKELTTRIKPKIALDTISNHDLFAMNFHEAITKLYSYSDDHLINEVYTIHKEIFRDNLNLFKDARYFLEYMNEINKPVILFTNELRSIVDKTLSHLNIEHYFTDIFAYEDVLNPKPSSKGLEMILEKYKLCKEEVVFVGDTLADEYAANNINVTSIFMN